MRKSDKVFPCNALSDSRNGGDSLSETTIMKTLLLKTLDSRAHGMWFILACLLLVCVLTGAILLANRVDWTMDRTTEQMTKPPSSRPHPRPLAPPNPATSH